MNTVKTASESKHISNEKVLSVIGQLLGGQGYPDPDNPQPHGPWDPYIRRVLQRMGPHPEPWKQRRINFAELNPQPLPPRARIVAALTQEIVDHSLLIKEVADSINQSNEERSIIIVSGKVDQYVAEFDELCPRLVWYLIFHGHPIGGDGGPVHPNWDKRFSSLEWLTAAAVFQQNSLTASNEKLKKIFFQAGAKLAEAGFARM